MAVTTTTVTPEEVSETCPNAAKPKRRSKYPNHRENKTINIKTNSLFQLKLKIPRIHLIVHFNQRTLNSSHRQLSKAKKDHPCQAKMILKELPKLPIPDWETQDNPGLVAATVPRNLYSYFMLTLLNESLWGDEAFSAIAVQKPFVDMLAVVIRDTAPPLFYLVGFIWVRLFGPSEIALRLLSLLLMLGAAIFTGLTVYHLSKTKLLALSSLLLAFFSPFLIPFAFEWRMYALLTFTVMGSIYFFVRRKWKSYILFATAGLYTHHFALFTLAGQEIAYAIFEVNWRRILKSKGNLINNLLRTFWPFLVIIGLYSFWLYPMYIQITRVKGAGFWLQAPSLSQVINLLWRFATGGVRESLRLVTAGLAISLLITKDWLKAGRRWLELVIIVSSPVIMSAIVSHLFTPIFYDRYLLSVVMGIIILLVAGTRKIFWPLVAVLAGLYLTQSYQAFINPQKRPFRDLAAFVKQEIKPGDYLVNYNGQAHHLWESKYYGLNAPLYTAGKTLPLYVGTALMETGDTISQLPSNVSRLGVITSEPMENVILPQPWQLQEVKDFHSLRLIWYSFSNQRRTTISE